MITKNYNNIIKVPFISFSREIVNKKKLNNFHQKFEWESFSAKTFRNKTI